MQEIYNLKKSEIKSRLKQFKNLTEKQQFQEFQFCLLTPQSQAKKCWQAIEELNRMKNPTKKKVSQILKAKTRFHNTKTIRILQAKETFKRIKPFLSSKNILELRNKLANEVNGYGLKEASHFLRNIGLSNNKIAILDRHILKNLKQKKLRSRKHYLEVEQKFLNYANKIKIPADELDLLWWSKENGEIFK